MTHHTLNAAGGLASLAAWRRRGMAYVDEGRGEPSVAIGDVWHPPHPMALPAPRCLELLEFALSRIPINRESGLLEAPTVGTCTTAYMLSRRVLAPSGECRNPGWMAAHERETTPMDTELEGEIVDRILAANARWWRFELDAVDIIVKHYRAGGGHTAHADWTPNKPRPMNHKISASIPLSDPESYEGGDFNFRRSFGPDFVPVPVGRERGELIVFPSWTLHEVTPVTRGERWVLLVSAYGPDLR